MNLSKKTITLFTAFLLIMILGASSTSQLRASLPDNHTSDIGPTEIAKILRASGYSGEFAREVLFVVSERVCSGNFDRVSDFLKMTEFRKKGIKVVFIGKSEKALRYNRKFENFQVDYFLETQTAQRKGIYVDAPRIAFLQGREVVNDSSLSCHVSFESLTQKIEQFLSDPGSESWREIATTR